MKLAWMLVVLCAAAEPHPIDPLLELTRSRLSQFRREVRTYECVVQHKERVRDRLLPRQTVFLRVRQLPFAVYARVLGPPDVAGREVLYNPKLYGEKVIIRNGGKRFAFITLALSTDNELLKEETNYPVQDWGIAPTLERVLDVLLEEQKRDDVEVEYFKDAKVDGRPASGAKITHPVPRPDDRFYQGLVVIDEELQLPVYYQATKLAKPGEPPVLLEEFSLSKLKFNVELTPQHFSHKHPEYKFDKLKEF
jgi:hypothetical protein